MDQDSLNALYTPVPTPAPVTPGFSYSGGFTPANQAMMGNLSGANPKALPPNMPVGSGNTMYQGPMFGQEDIGNVAGLLKAGDKKMFIPSVEEPEEEEKGFIGGAADAFMDAGGGLRADKYVQGAVGVGKYLWNKVKKKKDSE